MAKPTRIKEPAPAGKCDGCTGEGCWWVYTVMKSRSGNPMKRALGLFCLVCARERTGEATKSEWDN